MSWHEVLLLVGNAILLYVAWDQSRRLKRHAQMTARRQARWAPASLDAAWADVEEALPGGWTVEGLSADGDYWTASARGPLHPGIPPDDWPFVRVGTFPKDGSDDIEWSYAENCVARRLTTPAAALRALAAELRERTP